MDQRTTREVSHAGTQTDLRAVQCPVATGFAGRAHLLVRVHILYNLCGERVTQRVSKLRGRVCPEAHQTIAELEG